MSAKKPTTKQTKESKKDTKALVEQLAQVEKKLTAQEEITKRAQSDYFRLKIDMDAYIHRAEEAKKSADTDALVRIGAKLLPFITDLGHSLAHVPAHIADEAWFDGIRLIHQKTLQEVASLGIVPIPTEIGKEPDLSLHIPINMQAVEDTTLQGKIVEVVETGRQVNKNDITKVISPSKVIVGT